MSEEFITSVDKEDQRWTGVSVCIQYIRWCVCVVRHACFTFLKHVLERKWLRCGCVKEAAAATACRG